MCIKYVSNTKIMIYDKDKLFEQLMEAYISGSISDEDRTQLFALIQGSDQYRNQYEEMARLYALLHIPLLESQRNTSYEQFKHKMYGVFDGKKQKRMGWLVYLRNAAAVIALMVSISVGSVYMYKQASEKDSLAFYETVVPLGSQTKIILPDGSVAVLNSGSVLKYPLSFGEKERNVYLSGEAYFEVSKNKEKAFHVYAGDMKVRVTGTVFNVRSYPEDPSAEVNLIEGGVDVSVQDKRVHLQPNEKAVYDRESGHLESAESDAHKSALWRTGKLNFVSTSVVDLLKYIARRYDVKIHVESERAKQETFSGNINLNMTLQEVLDFINVGKKYSIQNSGDSIIVKDNMK